MWNKGFFINLLFISIFPTILYWLSIIYSIFFSKTGKNIITREFYECGFKAINDNENIIDIQFTIIGLIFLIYEMELVIFTPIFLNFYGLNFILVFYILASMFIIFLSYIYEIERYSISISY